MMCPVCILSDVTYVCLQSPLAGGAHSPQPSIEVIEQPRSRGLRFRYKCEGRSAGTIPGESSTNENRTYPTIRVSHHIPPPTIRVSHRLKYAVPGAGGVERTAQPIVQNLPCIIMLVSHLALYQAGSSSTCNSIYGQSWQYVYT